MHRIARLIAVVACLAGAVEMAPALAADRPMRRLAVGDLVRFVEGAGINMAEVLSGPDPSNYYLLTGSDGKPVSVPREKLRLVQSAGTKNAAFAAGEAVERGVDQRGKERGIIVRVNGVWCEFKPGAGDTEWVECRELHRTSPAGKAPI